LLSVLASLTCSRDLHRDWNWMLVHSCGGNITSVFQYQESAGNWTSCVGKQSWRCYLPHLISRAAVQNRVCVGNTSSGTCLIGHLPLFRIDHAQSHCANADTVFSRPRGVQRSAIFHILSGNVFFGYMSFFGPIFYIQSFALQTTSIGADLAFYLLPMLNAASVPGRIIPAYFARRSGVIIMLIFAALTTSIVSLCWIAVQSPAGLVVFSVLYGFFSGAFVSLPSVALMSLMQDTSKLGTRMGMCSVICGFGSLCGTPITGAILSTTGTYLGVQLFTAAIILLTSILLLIIELSRKLRGGSHY